MRRKCLQMGGTLMWAIHITVHHQQVIMERAFHIAFWDKMSTIQILFYVYAREALIFPNVISTRWIIWIAYWVRMLGSQNHDLIKFPQVVCQRRLNRSSMSTVNLRCGLSVAISWYILIGQVWSKYTVAEKMCGVPSTVLCCAAEVGSRWNILP